jgi:hypothetical protein
MPLKALLHPVAADAAVRLPMTYCGSGALRLTSGKPEVSLRRNRAAKRVQPGCHGAAPFKRSSSRPHERKSPSPAAAGRGFAYAWGL